MDIEGDEHAIFRVLFTAVRRRSPQQPSFPTGAGHGNACTSGPIRTDKEHHRECRARSG